MNKRAIAILGAIFLLIVGALVFLIFFRDGSDEPETEPEIVTQPPILTPTPEVFPTEPEIEIPVEPTPATRAIRLTDNAVMAPILYIQGDGITYFERTGQLFRTDMQITGTDVLLSNKQEVSIALKTNISRILWPSVGTSFIAEFDSLGKKTWSYYDISKGGYTDIPREVYSLDWVPGGEKIMFVWVDAEKKAFLNIANPDTTGYEVLTDFYEPDNVISVSPDGKNVLFHRTQTTDLSKNTINMVSSDGKTFKSVIQEGYNKGLKWAPDSAKFLFTKRDSEGKFNLWMGNVTTGEVRNLNVATTVEKAIWSKDSKSVIAGVPTTGTAGENTLTQDTIYKIDLSTIEKVEFSPGEGMDVQDMFMDSTEAVLFFRNGQDQALYYMPLK